ncbi:ATP-citrate synthase beta chain protein 2-like [Camellia sinensis]|uniref:ATP-citrate synthase beta chain protein 2-like n=1 Tax=Camellia sinensis TaxID=4442 RepID=UPI0010363FDF|nr:ATP-citrate synthase beta chain protein 2-like [Camellia sinensis]
MLDFDFLCGRETPSVAGIINPGFEGFQKLFFGQEEIAIPVHSAIDAASAAHPTADVFINFASFRSAAASSMAALKQPTIRVVAIIAEGVPESDAKQLIAYARANNKVVIGPATVGGIQAGAFKIGDTTGTIDNIIQCKLYRPGSVGFVSKSGGMSNEMYNTIARVTDGIYEGIAIGGDVFPGSTLSDHVLRFNNIPQIKMIVVLGELGGRDEYSLVEALKQGKINKPRYCTKFIEICIMLCVDHGPCVSGAHNTIVTARAGKDLVSSLVSGLLTIGPRFGGAIDDAARYFKDAYDRGLTPYEFVESMKKKGIRVPGIGHRIKRGDNRDKRVALLQLFARTNFPSVKYMEYAVQVETYTLFAEARRVASQYQREAEKRNAATETCAQVCHLVKANKFTLSLSHLSTFKPTILFLINSLPHFL